MVPAGVAPAYVQDLVEEFAYVEAETDSFFRRKRLGILAVEEPAFRGEGKFELVAVESGPVGGDDGGDGRYLEMAYAHQLVIDLLLFCLKLHFVGKRLPAASSAYSEMPAERFQPVFGRFHDPQDAAFHIVFLLLVYPYVDYVPGYGEFHEDHGAFIVRDGLSFGRHVLYQHVLENKVQFLSCHLQPI